MQNDLALVKVDDEKLVHTHAHTPGFEQARRKAWK